MIIDGVHVAITKEWINDVLAVRVEKQLINIEDLFLVTRTVSEKLEGDSFIETKYGRLRVFFRADLPKTSLAYILHKSKYDYPRKNNRVAEGIINYDLPKEDYDKVKSN